MTADMMKGITDIPQVLIALAMLYRARDLPPSPLATTWIGLWFAAGIGHALGVTLHLAGQAMPSPVALTLIVLVLLVAACTPWILFRFGLQLVGARAQPWAHAGVIGLSLLAVGMAFALRTWTPMIITLALTGWMVALAWRKNARCTPREQWLATGSGVSLAMGWAVYLFQIAPAESFEQTSLYHCFVALSLVLLAFLETRVRRESATGRASAEPVAA